MPACGRQQKSSPPPQSASMQPAVYRRLLAVQNPASTVSTPMSGRAEITRRLLAMVCVNAAPGRQKTAPRTARGSWPQTCPGGLSPRPRPHRAPSCALGGGQQFRTDTMEPGFPHRLHGSALAVLAKGGVQGAHADAGAARQLAQGRRPSGVAKVKAQRAAGHERADPLRRVGMELRHLTPPCEHLHHAHPVDLA